MAPLLTNGVRDPVLSSPDDGFKRSQQFNAKLLANVIGSPGPRVYSTRQGSLCLTCDGGRKATAAKDRSTLYTK